MPQENLVGKLRTSRFWIWKQFATRSVFTKTEV